MRDAFLRRAVELARENVRLGRGGPFGAVVVQDSRIIAQGVNLVTSTPDPTAHAEIMAIREACLAVGSFHLPGCEIYASCEPCPMCLGAIYWARLDRVFFAASRSDAARAGFSDQMIYEELTVPAGSRRIPMQQLPCEEALHAFEEWTCKTDRIDY